ncbi:hypothetical protein R1sor_024567 [Riccia sorocarpa]|uniref:Uncharacterized protein n=1 Tax=Riccia sorocarpa TaxID=122646 RepID=A0ABD3GUY5_9MARC
MERKGLKITLPTNPSQSGAAGTSTSGEGPKKLKGKAPVKKLNVVIPKKPTTGTVEAPKKSTIGTVEAPKKSTTGSAEAPKKSTTGSAKAPKKSTTGSAEAPKKSITRSAEAPKKSTTGSAEAPRKSTGTVETPKLKMGPTREFSNPKKKGTPGVTPELQASKLISGTSLLKRARKRRLSNLFGRLNLSQLQVTKWVPRLPSNQLGSSSRRTTSTANAPGPDNTTTSPEQSVQPTTVNPNGHSGDGGSVVDSGKKNLQVVEYNDESGDEDTSSKTKKRKVAVLEKKSGFQPDHHVVEIDQVAADVKMQLDPKTKDQLKPEFDELRKWFPLGDNLVYASISQLTDPDATVVYRPCSIRHVAEIQNSMISSADTPQPATVVPYKLEATGKKNFLNILTMKELKAFIKSGGKFMVIYGLHSMKATKNIIPSVGGNKDHDLYGRALQLSKRHIKIVRGDTPENILCKLSYLANEQNKTFAFETAFVEHVIHGRKQYSLLGSPARAMKGMSNTKQKSW